MHAIHTHDLMTWLMGPVASVFARTTTRVNAIEVEDCAVASLVMEERGAGLAGCHTWLAARDQPPAAVL